MSGGSVAPGDAVVQYVVVRRDLLDTWPLGAVIAQACHASTFALWEGRNDPMVQSYVSDEMHKVVLAAKDEGELRKVAESLQARGVEHKLWVEEPEHFPTCLATRPYPRSCFGAVLKSLKLLR